MARQEEHDIERTVGQEATRTLASRVARITAVAVFPRVTRPIAAKVDLAARRRETIPDGVLSTLTTRTEGAAIAHLPSFELSVAANTRGQWGRR